MDKPTLDSNYINFLRPHFLNLFETKINPAIVIDVFQRYNLKILTEKDKSLIRAETNNKGHIAGSVLLFERLVLYDGWYRCLLDVLRDREVKLAYVAEEMEEFKKCLEEQICKTEINDVDQILLTKCRLKLENEENKNKQQENIMREMECALQQCAQEKAVLEEKLEAYHQENAELRNKLEACHQGAQEKAVLEEKLEAYHQENAELRNKLEACHQGDNVLMQDERYVILEDFGISNIFQDVSSTSTSGVGTTRWMAAEIMDVAAHNLLGLLFSVPKRHKKISVWSNRRT